MNVYELLKNIDITSEVIFCYYTEEEYDRVEITEEQASNKEIKSVFISDDCICIEIYFE